MQDLPRTVDGKIQRAADLKELGTLPQCALDPSPPRQSASSWWVTAPTLDFALAVCTGNEQFKAKNYKKAIGHYMQIGLFLTGPPFSGGDAGGMAGLMGGGGDAKEKLTEEQQAAVDQLTFTANLNLAACYLKEEKYEKAAARATKVLEKDPKHVKALFRRGEARIYLNDLDRAREDLTTAEALAPEDKGIKSRLSLLDKREKHFAKKEKRTYAKMFAPAKTAEAASADEATGESEGQAGGPGPGAAASTDETSVQTSDDGGSASGVEGAPSPTSSPGPAAAAQDPSVAEALARVAAEGKGQEGGGAGESTYKW